MPLANVFDAVLIPTISSQGPASSATAARIDSVRQAVLAHFGADSREWGVVFTAGATAALKMVGEAFPWRSGSLFVHSRDSHNSVLGIREYAVQHEAGVRCVDLEGNGALPMEEADDLGPRSRCRSDGSESTPSEDIGLSAGTDHARHDREPGGGCSERRRKEIDGREEMIGQVRRGGEGAPRDQEDHSEGGDGRRAVGKPPMDDADTGANAEADTEREAVSHCLFAFPAECNATGVRPDLSIAGLVKRFGERVALGPWSVCPCSPRRGRRAGQRTPGATDGGQGSETPVTCPDQESSVRARDSKSSRTDRAPSPTERGDSGRRRPRSMGTAKQRETATRRRRRRWWVLLDAAKFVGTAPIDLSLVEADFVAVSFYKIFG